MAETLLSASNILLFGRLVEDLKIEKSPASSPHNPFAGQRGGRNHHLLDQLGCDNAAFARIYGFSYEGTYHELPIPALFLVHGDGVLATQEKNTVKTEGEERGSSDPHFARAPGWPSLTGLSAADFDFVDDLRVWSYDQADYTIRMDTAAGMFEQVLLESYFTGNFGVSGAKVSGAKVSGAKVSGAKVSGAKVSGAKVSGAKLSGGRDASD